MLVLTRKQNEKIRIGSSIVITVVRMKGKAVRLGIEAPSEMNILRGELAFESEENSCPGKNAKMETAAKDRSQDRPLRSKRSQIRTNTSPRNPTGNWSDQRQDERATSGPKTLGSPSWSTPQTNAVR